MFKLSEKVCDEKYGEGIVVEVLPEGGGDGFYKVNYPVEVYFDGGNVVAYTSDGRSNKNFPPSLKKVEE